jgi:hypothetical protein
MTTARLTIHTNDSEGVGAGGNVVVRVYILHKNLGENRRNLSAITGCSDTHPYFRLFLNERVACILGIWYTAH